MSGGKGCQIAPRRRGASSCRSAAASVAWKRAASLVGDAALVRRMRCRLAGAAAGRAAAAVRAATARRAATAAQRLFGIDREPVVGHVDPDIAGLGQKRLVDQKGESTRLKQFILVGRLIQSQGQARAGSAARREIDADGRGILVLEVALELLPGGIGYFNH